jgi:hypothetical protein
MSFGHEPHPSERSRRDFWIWTGRLASAASIAGLIVALVR